MYQLWIIVIIATVFIDLLTSNVLFVWYGIGAIAALILNSLGVPAVYQVITFAVVGTVLTLIFYPIFKAKVKKLEKTPTQEERYVGKEFTANEEIVDEAQVKIDGTYWTVKNEGEVIKQGQRYKVIRIEGIKLIIKKGRDLK